MEGNLPQKWKIILTLVGTGYYRNVDNNYVDVVQIGRRHDSVEKVIVAFNLIHNFTLHFLVYHIN